MPVFIASAYRSTIDLPVLASFSRGPGRLPALTAHNPSMSMTLKSAIIFVGLYFDI